MGDGQDAVSHRTGAVLQVSLLDEVENELIGIGLYDFPHIGLEHAGDPMFVVLLPDGVPSVLLVGGQLLFLEEVGSALLLCLEVFRHSEVDLQVVIHVRVVVSNGIVFITGDRFRIVEALIVFF